MRLTRWLKWLIVLTALLSLVIVVGYHFAVQRLKAEVEQALGPQSEIGSIELGWHALVINQLRIAAPAGWPSQDSLRAAQVRLVPNLRSLLGGSIQIAQIDVDGAYLSIWRTPAGKMRLLPSLLEKPKPDTATNDHAASAAPTVSIDRIRFHDGTLAFADDSVPRPVRLDVTALNIGIDNLTLPTLQTTTQLHLAGSVRGPRHEGQLTLDGVATLANHDSDIKLALKSVDLLPLAPYLLKASETGIKQGTLDLSIDSVVKQNHLHAPGQLTLHDLTLDSHGLMGVSQSAAVGLLKNGHGAITAKFTLDGNLNDPHFSLNENLLHRAGAGLADTMGVSVAGLARNVSNTAEGIGSKLKSLLH